MCENVRAANLSGIPFRPPPFEMASIMHEWNPRADPGDLPDVPASDSFSLAPHHLAADGNNRIDFAWKDAWRYRKLTGYIASIFEVLAIL